MKILIVTSGQPSLNPRLVKEADALADSGYHVTVLYAYWNDWATRFDHELLQTKKWKAIRVAGHPVEGRLTFLLSRIIHKAAGGFVKMGKMPYWAERAIARSSHFLIKETQKHEADLYIAHNLGALPAAVMAAKKHHKPCGFDAEDFHRNETSNDPQNKDVIIKTYIEDKYFPQLNYLTVSSPQIAHAYSQLFPKLNPVVILNVFGKSNLDTQQVVSHSPIRLFWFSQTIGPNRGIEDIVAALKLLKQPFELHLLGNRLAQNQLFLDKLNNSEVNITFHKPIPADELIAFASQYDVGLALEPAFSKNNDMALSNKIFTYLQAGLAIIASDTTAQMDFIKNNPEIGFSYSKGNISELAAILSKFNADSDILTGCKQAALKKAHEVYNWENESKKFLNLINNKLSTTI